MNKHFPVSSNLSDLFKVKKTSYMLCKHLHFEPDAEFPGFPFRGKFGESRYFLFISAHDMQQDASYISIQGA